MIYSDYDLREWKREQLEYYRNYQKSFTRDSREFNQLNEKIQMFSELI